MGLESELFRNDPRLAAAAVNNPPLKIGETGASRRKTEAGALGLEPRAADLDQEYRRSGWHLWSETKAVVMQFQAAQGLSADGIAGAMTLPRVDALLVAGEANGEIDLLRLWDEQRPLCMSIAPVRAEFNPIRDVKGLA